MFQHGTDQPYPAALAAYHWRSSWSSSLLRSAALWLQLNCPDGVWTIGSGPDGLCPPVAEVGLALISTLPPLWRSAQILDA